MKRRTFQSPVGQLEIMEDEDSIVELRFDSKGVYAEESHLLDICEKELNEYFKRARKKFSFPIKLRGTPFQNRVWKELQNIPYGRAISYSDLAMRLGDLKSIRAAGTANGKNKLPIIVPCHRVIGKDGSLVGFAGGLEKKKWLLQHEGVIPGEQMNIFESF